jgi:hypothetical protein
MLLALAPAAVASSRPAGNAGVLDSVWHWFHSFGGDMVGVASIGDVANSSQSGECARYRSTTGADGSWADPFGLKSVSRWHAPRGATRGGVSQRVGQQH